MMPVVAISLDPSTPRPPARESEPRAVTWRRPIFFAALFAYLYTVGGVALPRVHYFHDAVSVRDMATSWQSLTWNIGDGRFFLPVALLSQHEGVLQFVLMNGYAHLVGDLFPLDPATMQFPNTVLAWLCAVMIYRLGRTMHSERAGDLGALVFALTPWVGVMIRLPWIFNLLSVLTQLTTLLLYAGLVREPGRRRYRVGAPLALAVYLTTGVDWPSFVSVLLVFVVLAGGTKAAFRNRHNVYPLAVVAVYAAWAVALYGYGRYYEPRHAHLYQQALLVFPFFKVATTGGLPSIGQVASYAADALGVPLVFAVGGAVTVLRRPACGLASRVTTSLRLSLVVWLAVAVAPLLKTSNSATYAYVTGVSVSLLAAVALTRLRTVGLVVVTLALLAGQWHTVTTRGWRTIDDGDRRVLAAAAFLIERRPDLLGDGKVAFLPRNLASNVGQYARGRNERIVMPPEFPVEMTLHAVGSKAAVLTEFVTRYTDRGDIGADWLILSSEVLSDTTRAAGFYRRLRGDPRIRWFASFTDEQGRALWIGEVARGPAGGGGVTGHDVDAWAEVYERKYDRISYLKRNVRRVL